MKTMKKVGAIVLALCMCMSLCVTAFAADENSPYSITIDNAVIGQTYNAYKIFDVTYEVDEDGNPTGNVAYTITSTDPWYETVSAATGVFKLTATSTTDNVTKYTVETVEGVTDDQITAVFTNAIVMTERTDADGNGTGVYELTAPAGVSYAATSTATANGTLTLYLDEPGYYFVTSTLGSVVSITTADPDAVIIEKNNPPGDLHKYIVDGLEEDGSSHGDTEAMGDDVNFEVTANVPLYAPSDEKSAEGYLVTDYEFIDHMSAGLEIRGLTEETDYTVSTDTEGVTHYYATNSLINSWVTIYDGNTSYDLTDVAYNVVLELTDVTYYTDEDGNEQIQFDGFTLSYETIDMDVYDSLVGDGKEYPEGFETAYELAQACGCNYPANATIEIDYTAHVTDAAVYDNTNVIEMDWHMTTYRNPNPLNPEYGGSSFDSDDVYVLQLEILKVDGSDMTKVLEGAEFQLTGTNLQDVVTSTDEHYEALESYADYEAAKDNSNNEICFKLKDGTYTTVDPYTLTDQEVLSEYEVNPYYGDPMYPDAADYPYVAYIHTVTHSGGLQSGSGESGSKTVTGWTDEEGKLVFSGLTVGSWTLTEITAPDGYNLLPEDFEMEITVTWGVDNESGKIVPTFNLDSSSNSSYELVDGVVTITVENNSGTELPGTGGMGTTIFYVVGAILICGAAVVLITRRRMAH